MSWLGKTRIDFGKCPCINLYVLTDIKRLQLLNYFCNSGKKFHQFIFQPFSSVLLPYCYMNWTLLVHILWRVESQKHFARDGVEGQYGGLGMITRPLWKCPCIKLFITYFRHLEKRHSYWPETKSRLILAWSSIKTRTDLKNHVLTWKNTV
jgi:hypothetical protein